jgi:hypothetical protein
MILDKFNIGDTISFQVYPSTLYGTAFNRVKVSDLISARSTSFFNFDAQAEHLKVLSDVNTPPGQVPQSYDAYQYLVFFTTAAPDKPQVVGIPWIKADSITVDGSRDAVGYFPGISDAQLTELRKAISAIGLTGFQVDFK